MFDPMHSTCRAGFNYSTISKRKSLELVRHSLRDVMVQTFDEHQADLSSYKSCLQLFLTVAVFSEASPTMIRVND